MEEKEKNIIVRSMAELIQNTYFSDPFLAFFESERVMTREEGNTIRNTLSSKGEHAAMFELYNTLIRKCNGFNILKKALKETLQSRAFVILTENCNSHADEDANLVLDTGRDMSFLNDHPKLLDCINKMVVCHPCVLVDLRSKGVLGKENLAQVFSMAKKEQNIFLVRLVSDNMFLLPRMVAVFEKYCQLGAVYALQIVIEIMETGKSPHWDSHPVAQIYNSHLEIQEWLRNDSLDICESITLDNTMLQKFKEIKILCESDFDALSCVEKNQGSQAQVQLLLEYLGGRHDSVNNLLKVLRKCNQTEALENLLELRKHSTFSTKNVAKRNAAQIDTTCVPNIIYSPEVRVSLLVHLTENRTIQQSKAFTIEFLMLKDPVEAIRILTEAVKRNNVIYNKFQETLKIVANEMQSSSQWLQECVQDNLLHLIEISILKILQSLKGKKSFPSNNLLYEKLKEDKFDDRALLWSLISSRTVFYQIIEDSLREAKHYLIVELVRNSFPSIRQKKKEKCCQLDISGNQTVIREALVTLVETTILTPTFLALMLSKGILSLYEYNTLQYQDRPDYEKRRQFYDILGTRNCSLSEIIEALENENQTDAASCLTRHIPAFLISSSKYCSNKSIDESSKLHTFQRDVFRVNLYDLVRITETDETLLERLCANSILSKQDRRAIMSNKSNSARSSKLYDILSTRVAKMKEIHKSMMECGQVIVADLLKDSCREYNILLDSNNTITQLVQDKAVIFEGKTFQRGVNGLSRCLAENNFKYIFVETNFVDLTKLRIQETLEGDLNAQKNENHCWKVQYLENNNATSTKSFILFRECLTSCISNCLFLPKIVIVIPENRICECLSKFENSSEYSLLKDEFHWTALTVERQNFLLQQNIRDQGVQRQVRHVTDAFIYEREDEFFANFLRNDLLASLLVGEIPDIFRETIPTVSDYIERKLKPRNFLSKALLKNLVHKDVIVILGEKEKFLNIAFDCSQNVVRDMPSDEAVVAGPKVYLRSSERDFNTICKQVEDHVNVHLLKHCPRGYLWIKSKASSLELISNHLEAEQTQQLNENEAINYFMASDHHIVISDSAGMGKTTLLASLARRTQEKVPNSLAIFLVLKDIVPPLADQITKDSTDGEIEQVLLRRLAEAAGKFINEDIFPKNVFLFLDSFDEVPEDYIGLALKCIFVLGRSNKIQRIHVTTRPNLVSRLERCLVTIAYEIHSFSHPDQIEFLTNYWSRTHEKFERSKLESYAESCIQGLNRGTEHEFKHLAGIPLQCLLVAEIFEKPALKFATSFSTHSKQGLRPTIEIGSAAELYEKLFKRKFKKYKRRLKVSQFKIAQFCMRRLNVYLSIREIFPKEISSMLELHLLTEELQEFLNIFVDDWHPTLQEFRNFQLPWAHILDLGFVERFEKEEKRIRFLHQTFAEYFLASFIVDCLRGLIPQIEIVHLIFKQAFDTVQESVELSRYKSWKLKAHNFKYPQVMFLVNSILLNNSSKFPCKVEFPEDMADAVVSACIANNYCNTLKFMLSSDEMGGNLALLSPKNISEHLQLAAKCSTLDIIIKISEHAVEQQIKNSFAVQIVAERGDFDLFENLFNSPVLKPALENLQHLVHFCVSNTTDSSELILENKEKILLGISKIQDSSVDVFQRDDVDDDGRAPYVLPFVHLRLIKCLAKVDNEEIQSTDSLQNNILHVAAKSYSGKDFIELVSFLATQEAVQIADLLLNCNVFGERPLHLAPLNTEDVKKLFVTLAPPKANPTEILNPVDNHGYSILWSALERNCTSEDIGCFIRHGANLSHKDKFGRTSFHIGALHCSDTEILEYFLETKLDINLSDVFGNTPIYYAARNQNSSSKAKLLGFFLNGNKAVNLNHQNKRGETIFHFAVRHSNHAAFKYLWGRRMTLANDASTIGDNEGNTITHHALRYTNPDTNANLHLILKTRPGEMSVLNKVGESPLEHALNDSFCDISIGVFEVLLPFITKISDTTLLQLSKHLEKIATRNPEQVENVKDLINKFKVKEIIAVDAAPKPI